MKILNHFFCLFLLTVAVDLNAQDKFEKESRIKPQDVPALAYKFIDSLNLKTKVKWYKEEGLNKTSIEAKFKQKQLRYSVEFDINGNIEDVEVEAKYKTLEPKLKDTITAQLNKQCISHSIQKVQRQFTGSESVLFALFKTENLTGLSTKYELIVKCKQKNSVNLFEYLFNDQGQILSTSKIVFKNSSHLEY